MKKLFALALALTALLFAGCNQPQEELEYEIWSPSATEKIYRDIAYDAEKKSEKRLEIGMAKNEYESDQLIVTVKTGRVSAYSLAVCDLTNPSGGVIPKENISVYMEHYINVTKKNNNNNDYPTGYTPDALVPLGLAAEKGENRIEKGKNQGLYITVKTDKDTGEGIYTGAFALTLNGETISVPVKVTVWAFAVPDTVGAQSCFMLNRNDIMNGELDNTEEMYETYYETMLRYRLSPLSVPKADRGLEGFLSGLEKYYDAPGFSAYGIPHSSDGTDVIYSELKSTLKAIAGLCTEEKNYFEKGYYYIYDLIDEPHLSADGGEKTKRIVARIDAAELEAFEELEDEGFFSGKSEKFKAGIKASMSNIPNVVTTWYDESFAQNPLTWCPTVDKFNDEESRALYASEKERSGSLWWYTCAAPNYPSPGYHIDDNLVGARVMSWMQKAYDVDGNLYWATTTYNKIELNQHGEDNITRPIDPYADPQRMSERWIANGDGYLFYPGAKYGADYPFASMRLEAIRDGLEEYEYLRQLETLYAGASEYYGMEISAEKKLSGLYSRLFSGTIYSQSHTAFEDVRKELAGEIVAAKENPAKFYVTDVETNLDTAAVTFVADAGYSVKVNGRAVAGEKQGGGYLYKAEIKLDGEENNAVVELTDGEAAYTYSTYLSGKVVRVATFDDESELSKFTAAKTVTLSLSDEHALGGYALKAVAESQDKLGYYPSVTLKASALGLKPSEIDRFDLSIFNSENENVKVTFVLLSDTSEYVLGERTLKAGEWTAVSVGKLYATDWSGFAGLTGIEFRLENFADESTLLPRRTLYIDNITVSKRSS